MAMSFVINNEYIVFILMPVTRDHFVPESYLKQFCNGNNQFYCYDKSNDKSFLVNPKKVAKQRGFYTLPKEIHYQGKAIENILSDIEKEQAIVFKNLINYIKEIVIDDTSRRGILSNILKPNQKIELAYAISIQYLRTTKHRDFIVELYQKTEFNLENEANEVLNNIITKLPKKFKDIDLVNRNKIIQSMISNLSWSYSKGLAGIQAKDMFKRCSDFVDIILNHIWVIGWNNFSKEKPLWTSDNPVAKYPEYAGIASEGVKIAFPLNSEIVLILLEKEHYNKLKCWENSVLQLTLNQIDYLNFLQLGSSKKFIFSSNDKFFSS